MRRLLLFLIARATPASDREWVIGDTVEEFTRIDGLHGRAAARRWLVAELVRVLLTAPRHRQASRRGWAWQLDTLGRDIRFAMRMFVRDPGFTAVAVVTLAVGIGGAATVFTIADPLLFRQLSVPNAHELVSLRLVRPPAKTFLSFVPPAFSFPDLSLVEFEGFERAGGSFSNAFLAAATTTAYQLAERQTGDSGRPVQVETANVSAGFFATLGITPVLGRGFGDEDRRGPLPVGVISDSLWRRAFAQDPQVLGKVITLTRLDRRRSVAIIGVAPAGFLGTEVGKAVDLWMTLAPSTLSTTPRDLAWWNGGRMMARLRPGIDLKQARGELMVVHQRLVQTWLSEFTEHLTPAQREALAGQRLVLESGAGGWSQLRTDFSQPLSILIGAAGSVLFIACVNLVVLSIARGMSRGRDIALRLALGSGRVRLVRQHLTASAVLALAGGGLGLVFAWWGSKALLSFAPALKEAALDFTFTGSVLRFTVAISIVSALLIGLPPALRLTSSVSSASLRFSLAHSSGTRSTLNRVLVLSQFALALVVLVIAGLFVRTLQNLRAVDVGFEKERVVRVEVDTRADYLTILSRLERLPGVETGTAWSTGLFADGMGMVGPIIIDGGRTEQDVLALSTSVGPRFFETMGISLIHGRQLRSEDASSHPRGVVVSSAFARHFFGADRAAGRQFRLNRRHDAVVFEVVGVAEDAKYRSLREEAQWIVYSPLSALPQRVNVAVRTSGDPSMTATAIRDALRQSSPAIQLGQIRTLSDVTEATVLRERFLAQVGTLIGGLALFLACFGLFGTTAYAVVQRTSEIGIRMALGAEVGDIIRMLMREIGWPVGGGAMLGVLAAGMTTQVVESLLFGVDPSDPWTMTAALVILVSSATGAAYLAARRTACIQPVTAIKYE